MHQFQWVSIRKRPKDNAGTSQKSHPGRALIVFRKYSTQERKKGEEMSTLKSRETHKLYFPRLFAKPPSIICFGTWFAPKAYPYPFNIVCHLDSAKRGMQLDWKNHVEALRTELPQILRIGIPHQQRWLHFSSVSSFCLPWLRIALYCWCWRLVGRAKLWLLKQSFVIGHSTRTGQTQKVCCQKRHKGKEF